MKTSEQTDQILPKLANAIKELGGVKKSANNPFFKSKYADLNTHLDVAEASLDTQGLILLQPVSRDERGSFVETIILDPKSGQFVSSAMDLVLNKQSMQDMGSAVTYARRYTLGALLSMQALDDDGETAMGRGKASPAPQPQAQAASTAKRSSFRGAKATGPNPVVVAASQVNSNEETTEGWE